MPVRKMKTRKALHCACKCKKCNGRTCKCKTHNCKTCKHSKMSGSKRQTRRKHITRRGGFAAALKGAMQMGKTMNKVSALKGQALSKVEGMKNMAGNKAAASGVLAAAKNKAMQVKNQALNRVEGIKSAATDQTKAVKAALCKKVCGCGSNTPQSIVENAPQPVSTESSLQNPIAKSPISNDPSNVTSIARVRSPPNVQPTLSSLKTKLASPGNTIKRNLFGNKNQNQRRVDPDRRGVLKGARDD